MFFLAAYFAWVAQELDTFHLERPAGRYYPLLIESFLYGQKHLLIKPSSELLGLPNPWDWQANGPFRLHDATLYQGEYYLYYGLGPLLLMLPYRLVFGRNMSEEFAVFVYFTASMVLAGSLLFSVWRRYLSRAPFWIVLLGTAVFSLSSGVPRVLSRPYFYEAAVASALFYGLIAHVFIYKALSEQRHRLFSLSLAGLFMGLAVSGRPEFVLWAVLIPKVLWDLKRIKAWSKIQSAVKPAAAFVVPWITVGLGLAAYNYLRFKNPLDTGLSRSLCGKEIGPFSSTAEIPFNFHFYLLRAPVFTGKFPFFSVDDLSHTGFLWTFPVLLLFGPSFIRWLRSSKFKKVDATFPVDALIENLLVGSGILFLFLVQMGGFSNRYVIDFAPYMVVAVIIFWMRREHSLDMKPVKSRFRDAAVLLALSGATLGASIGLSGAIGDAYIPEVHPLLQSERPQILLPREAGSLIYIAELETSLGTIVCRLFDKEVPGIVENFIGLASGSKKWKEWPSGAERSSAFYENRPFFRVTPGYMIATGGQGKNGEYGPGFYVNDEWRTAELHFGGGYLMTNDQVLGAAGSQFAISLAPTPWLIGRSVIFGQVIEGFDVAKRISEIPHDEHDRPLSPVILKHVRIIKKISGLTDF